VKVMKCVPQFSLHVFEKCSLKIFSELTLHILAEVLVCLHEDCSGLLPSKNLHWSMVTGLINFDSITRCFIKTEFSAISFNANFASVHV